MAEGKEPKGFSFDDDDDEWMSSKVTGFKFEDDDDCDDDQLDLGRHSVVGVHRSENVLSC